MNLSKNKQKILFQILLHEMDNTFLNSTVNLTINWITKSNNNMRNFALMKRRNQHFRIPDFYEKWISKYLEYDFYLHFRMCRNTFKNLTLEINHFWKDSPYRGGYIQVPLEKSVLVTLWYLGKGETMISTGDRFNLANSTVHFIVGDICKILCQLLSKYIVWPTEEECAFISEEFEKKAGYPGVIGAIDGCHICCKIPQNQHDSYQDRKFHHSISIQGICSASKIFTNVAIGYPGSLHDARILEESYIGRTINNSGFQALFYNTNYHLVGDSAYPCRQWLMTPYRDTGRLTALQKKHNCCLSTTRVAIENVFGLLKGRWRILKYVNVYSTERAINIISACCMLHSFCLIRGDDFDCESDDALSQVDQEENVERDNCGIQKRNYIASILK